MREVTINIQGKSYPCYPTAGAMLRYRRIKGKEASSIDLNDLDNVGTYLFCCCKSACVRDSVEFPFHDEQHMMDCLLTEDIESWGRSVAEAAGETAPDGDAADGDGEKKSPSA